MDGRSRLLLATDADVAVVMPRPIAVAVPVAATAMPPIVMSTIMPVAPMVRSHPVTIRTAVVAVPIAVPVMVSVVVGIHVLLLIRAVMVSVLRVRRCCAERRHRQHGCDQGDLAQFHPFFSKLRSLAPWLDCAGKTGETFQSAIKRNAF